MKRKFLVMASLSIFTATGSAQPANDVESTSGAFGAAATAAVVEQIRSDSAQAPDRQAAFAAEAVDSQWASRMTTRINEHIAASGLALSAFRTECRSTACLIEITSTVSWSSTDEREQFETQLRDMVQAFTEGSIPDDFVGLSSRTTFDAAQECRITGELVLRRYPNDRGPRSSRSGSVSMADAARCS